ncbi:hypothetical protein [Saccharothrix sp. NRRL B-16348]|uniref:hypothetical protein n=1 Tax=Saccharothrix sp. NRRL B-16348 TaxID=1415542 RepID=UPI0006AE1F2D|nr:hypothetical protein [Saccharothrix sp. NRRL B-16348]
MNAPQYYQPYGHPPGPPPRKRRTTGKVVVALVAVVVLVAAGITVALALRSSDETPIVARSSAPMADAGPPARDVLVQRIEDGPATYGASPVFDACAVLPRAALADVGFPEDVTDYRESAYLPASVTPDRATLRKVSEFDPITECGYWIRGADRDDAYVVLEIAQLPFNALRGRELGTSQSSGLAVATRRSDDQFFAEIGNGDSRFAAHLVMGRVTSDVDGVPAEAVFGKLVDAVAAGLAAGPTARGSYAFTGPYEDLPFACDVLDAEVFTELTGKPDSGRVEVRDTSAHETDRDYRGIGRLQAVEQRCTRSSTDRFAADDSGARTLTASFETFRGEAQAASAHAFQCDPENPAGAVIGEPVPLDEEVGDAKPCVRPIGYLNYVFLIGRTSVRIMPDEGWAGTDPEDFGREFTPLARKFADVVRERF